MELQLNPSIATSAIPESSPVQKPPEAAAAPTDGVRISTAFAALDWGAKIDQVTVAVQSGSYQVSSAATGNAIIEDAILAGTN
ncbi:MAG TPA: hypothetical protein VHY84_14675 [Bryobacteraceae bacterium]|jgi:hypothetical protein|nr:hypothetical protein [Bryobacteraceae bacterium]